MSTENPADSATNSATDRMAPRGRRFVAPAVAALVGGVVAALAITAGISAFAGSEPYDALGNTDPGAVIRLGTPMLRALVDIGGTLCAGSFAYAACCSVGRSSGTLSPDGYAALRNGGRAAVVWCVASLAMVPFSEGSVAGQPIGEVVRPENLLGLLDALEPPKAWLISGGIALVVALAAARTLRRRPAAALLVLAILALLPPLATGHSSSDAGHDLATAAIMIHVPAAAIWIGVLAAFLARAHRQRRLPEDERAGSELRSLTLRYSRLAAWCWIVLAISGLVDAAVMVPAGAVFESTYGMLLAATVALMIVLGITGIALRRRALAAVRDRRGGSRSVLRLAAGELAVLLGTVGISAVLTHFPPPAFVGHPVTAQQTLLGYDLAGPPTVLRLLTDWRIDVLFGPLAVVLALVYVAGIVRLRRRGEHWHPGRAAAWLGGCLVLLLATSSGIGRYGSAMFSIHLAGHMLVSMLVPVLLALGGPLTLARRALPEARDGELPGPREWLDGLAGSPPVRLLTHPLVALLLFAGSPFLLYFTGIFDASVRFHWAHLAIDAYFLLVGYFFAWPVIGVDAAPRPLPNLARVGMLLAAMPADIVLGAAIMTTGRVIGNGPTGGNMYDALALPWVRDLLADQSLGGGIGLAISEGTLLVAVGALLLRWSRVDEGIAGDDGTGLADYERILLDARHNRP